MSKDELNSLVNSNNSESKSKSNGKLSGVLNKELIYGQSEQYVEFTPDGQIKNSSSSLTSSSSSLSNALLGKSKYEEDVYLNNHSSIFGSYWDRGRWGYLFGCINVIYYYYFLKDVATNLKEIVIVQVRLEDMPIVRTLK
jgi:pre-mRNA-processing factor SLU7